MEIQVKLWNGQDDPDNPKTGTPGMTLDAVYEALRGRVVSAIGGVAPHTDTVSIGFTDGTNVQFWVSKGVPRVLVYKGKSPP
jgi:hypothetical protein